MPKRKEILLVLLTTFTTSAFFVFAQSTSKPLMGPASIEWNTVGVKTNANGFFRKFFESPTATLELLECHVTTLNPEFDSHLPHRHPEEELIIIQEGTVESLVNGVWKRVGPGSVIFNACNVTHALRNVGDTPATYHVIMWRSSATPKGQTVMDTNLPPEIMSHFNSQPPR